MKTEERLAALRKEHGLSQAELAERMNVSRQAVSRWENGQSAPSTENLIGLSQLYGVSLDEVVNGREENAGEGGEAPQEAEGPAGEPTRIRFGSAGKKKGIAAAIILLALLIIIWCYASAGKKNQEVVDIGKLETNQVEISESFGF